MTIVVDQPDWTGGQLRRQIVRAFLRRIKRRLDVKQLRAQVIYLVLQLLFIRIQRALILIGAFKSVVRSLIWRSTLWRYRS